LLYLVSGATDVLLRDDSEDASGERVIALQGGEACIVPQGAWHRQVVMGPSLVLFLSPNSVHVPYVPDDGWEPPPTGTCVRCRTDAPGQRVRADEDDRRRSRVVARWTRDASHGAVALRVMHSRPSTRAAGRAPSGHYAVVPPLDRRAQTGLFWIPLPMIGGALMAAGATTAAVVVLSAAVTVAIVGGVRTWRTRP
jgi:hypothetical protein